MITDKWQELGTQEILLVVFEQSSTRWDLTTVSVPYMSYKAYLVKV